MVGFASLILCVVSISTVVFGANYNIAIIANGVNLLLAAMNLKIVYLAAARYAKEDLLNVENTKFPAVAEFFRPILDLFRLPVNSNFPVYIWITYIFHVMGPIYECDPTPTLSLRETLVGA